MVVSKLTLLSEEDDAQLSAHKLCQTGVAVRR